MLFSEVDGHVALKEEIPFFCLSLSYISPSNRLLISESNFMKNNSPYCHKVIYFFLFIALLSCTTSGQNKADVSTSGDLPSHQELREALRDKREVVLVHSNGEAAAQLSQTAHKIAEANSYLQFKVMAADEVDVETQQNSILLLLGSPKENPVLAKMANLLPLQLTEEKITFAKKEFQNPETLFRLSFYPNPLNPQLPLYLISGFSDQTIIDQLDQVYQQDYSGLFWSSWGYQFFEKGRCTLLGSFHPTDWTLDPEVQWDFSDPVDTLAQTPHFDFIGKTNDFSVTIISGIAKQCENTFLDIEKFCDRTATLPKIPYHLYASSEEKGLILYNTEQSHVSFKKNEVHTVVNEEFRDNFLQTENELLIRHLLGKPQYWMLENGLSIYFTQKWQRKGYAYWAKRLFQSNNQMPLAELLDEKLYQKESDLIKGSMAGAFVEFLIEKWGREIFVKRYTKWSPDAQEISTLQREWEQYMERKVPVLSAASPASPNYWQGFNFAHEGYRVYNGYISKEATRSLQVLKDLGTTAVAIVPYTYMERPDRPTFLPFARDAGSENDESVIHAIHAAHNQGMQSLLKPQVWLGGGSWSGFVAMNSKADWITFFDHYYRWIRHFAMLAEIHEATALSVGVEFGKATLGHEEEWKTIFRKLRGIYSGQLTYCANWGEEFENLQFWDELDFIGLNCYYPLSSGSQPSQKELAQGFDNVLKKVEKIARRFQKPIVFTEIGFRPVEGTWKNPHAEAGGRAFQEKNQQMCYEVVHRSIHGKEWCQGILWWKWPSYLEYGKRNQTGFSPYNRAAEEVVKKWFGKK